MRTFTYSFAFLLSPPDPLASTLVGQSFALTYQNSEGGSGYLFQYIPFEQRIARVNPGPVIADKVLEPARHENRLSRHDRRVDHLGMAYGFYSIHTRKKYEALLSPMFETALKIVGEGLMRIYQIAGREDKEGHFVTFKVVAERTEDQALTMEATLSSLMRECKGIKAELDLASIQDSPEALIQDLEIGYRDKESSTALSDPILYLGSLSEWPLEAIEIGRMLYAHREDRKGIRTRMKYASSIDSFDRDASVIGGLWSDSIRRPAYWREFEKGIRPDQEGLWERDMSGVRHTVDEAVAGREVLAYRDIQDGHMDDRYTTAGRSRDSDAKIDELVWFSPDKESILAQVDTWVPAAYKGISHHGHIPYMDLFSDHIKGTDARIDWTDFMTDLIKSSGAWILQDRIYVDGVSSADARVDNEIVRVDRGGKAAENQFNFQMVEGPTEAGVQGFVMSDVIAAVTQGAGARTVNSRVKAEDFARNAEGVPFTLRVEGTSDPAVVTDYGFTLLDGKDPYQSLETPHSDIVQVGLMPDAARIIEGIPRMEPLPFDAKDFEILMARVDKLSRTARIIEIIQRVGPLSQAALIVKHKDLMVDKLERIAREENPLIPTDKSQLANDHAEVREGFIPDMIRSKKAEKDSLDATAIFKLLADREDLDAILFHAIFATSENLEARIEEWVEASHRQDCHLVLQMDGVNLARSKEEERAAYVLDQLLIGCGEQAKIRDSYIPTETYLLAGDRSEWDDIWNSYAPGVDVIDVPHTDYDYGKLAAQVYDPETGIPKEPIGPTNKPDVKVKLPLHHPLPSHNQLGLKEVIVDNYVLIDLILAVQSLKNRNKLRFAGMPAEKAMRELFSSLYAWIQQAAPGHEEYERAFRFFRWYAESVVIKMSDHILHRVYDKFMSQIHDHGDLGLIYTADGWQYYPGAMVIQTTATEAVLNFSLDNYIDGHGILRGYFDNPERQGTMILEVDGSVIHELPASHNGIFVIEFDMPQGSRIYDITFRGDSGRISLSSFEMTGCVFKEAYTVSDDSNTNGLKAIGALINNLLAYYDRHHGDGKTKGSMEIMQRRTWMKT